MRRKIQAYHVHVQIGCIAQGLLIHLAVNPGGPLTPAFSGGPGGAPLARHRAEQDRMETRKGRDARNRPLQRLGASAK